MSSTLCSGFYETLWANLEAHMSVISLLFPGPLLLFLPTGKYLLALDIYSKNEILYV